MLGECQNGSDTGYARMVRPQAPCTRRRNIRPLGNSTSGYSDALHIRDAIGSSRRRPPAELPHHAAFSNSREPRLTLSGNPSDSIPQLIDRSLFDVKET